VPIIEHDAQFCTLT